MGDRDPTWPEGSQASPSAAVEGAEQGGAAFEGEGPRYESGGELGRGGMGRVVSAWDRRLGRLVALKELHPGLDERRMEREARITALLEHPGIVPVYDAGLSPDGRPFYTMRLVHGRALDTVLRATPEASQRLALLRRVHSACEAVGFAHSRGVVHRDLKPANILLGEHGETQVVDWGLARRWEDPEDPPGDGSSDPMLTRPGGVVGTPIYMSPEQADGRQASPASDVWSLGVVLYEVVAGAPPFVASSSEEVLQQLRTAVVPAITEPPELGAIIGRALSRDLEVRYPDATALAQDLGRYLDGRRVGAYAYSSWELARRAIVAFRLPIGVGAVALLAVALSLTVGQRRTAQERDRALRAEQDTRTALEAADQSLARSLLAQAQVALSRGARAESEVLAAHSLRLHESPGARGVLAAWAESSRPERLGATQAPSCQVLSTGSAMESLACIGMDGSLSWWEGVPLRQVWSTPGDYVSVALAEDAGLIWAARDTEVEVREVATGALLPERFPGRGLGWDLRVGRGGRVAWLDTTQALPLRLDLDGALSSEEQTCPTLRGVFRASGADLEVDMCVDGSARVRQGGQERRFTLPFNDKRTVSAIALSPDGLRLAVGTYSGELATVDLQAGKVAEQMTLKAGIIEHLAWSLDGRLVAAATEQGGVRLWRPGAVTEPQRLFGTRPRRIGFSDAHTLVSLGEERVVWGVPTHRFPNRLPGEAGITSADWSPDGATLAVARGDGVVELVDVASGMGRARLKWQDLVVKDGVFHPDGSYWSSGMGLAQVLRFSADERVATQSFPSMCRRLAVASQGVLCLGFADQSQLLTEGGPVHLPLGPLFDTSASADGRWLAVVGGGGLGRFEPGSTELRWKVEGDDWVAVDVADDGTLVGLSRSFVQVVGGPRFEVPGTLVDVAVTGDGELVAAGGLDGELFVWSVLEGRLLLEARGHEARVASVEFAPGGQRLATGSWDGSARIWDLGKLRTEPSVLVAEVEKAWALSVDQALSSGLR